MTTTQAQGQAASAAVKSAIAAAVNALDAIAVDQTLVDQFITDHPDPVVVVTPPPPVVPVVSITGLTITPAAPGNSMSAAIQTSTANGPLTVPEWCVSVRAAVNPADNGSLDFPHVLNQVFTGSQSFTAGVTAPAAGNYTAQVSMKINGVWGPYGPIKAFTVAAPIVTPPPVVTPPAGDAVVAVLGTRGARSGLGWNAGLWPLDRSGSAASYTSMQQYQESQSGRKVDVTRAAQYATTWGDITGMQILQFLCDYANQPGGPIPVIMLPVWPSSIGGSWTAAANGDYDSFYNQIGAQIEALRPSGPVIVELGWEDNGNWYDDSIVNKGGAAAFATGFARLIAAMKKGAGAKASSIKIQQTLSGLDDKGAGDPLTVLVKSILPSIDIIGMDTYDEQDGDDEGDAMGVTTSSTVPGWAAAYQRLYDFAKANGKLIAFPEWGLNHSTGHAAGTIGNDNPLFITAMHAWMLAHKDILAWESYFQDDALTNVNSSLFSPDVHNNPLSTAAYKLAFV